MNPVWKLNFFLFNIEVYGEFFSDITPIRGGIPEGIIAQVWLTLKELAFNFSFFVRPDAPNQYYGPFFLISQGLLSHIFKFLSR